MSKITLRPDQEEVRTKVRIAMRSNHAVLVVAATGWGKTVFASALIHLIIARGKKVIFAVHRVDLIKQTAETFKAFGVPFSYIAAGYRHNPLLPVQIASIATLQNRLGKYGADYIFVDEAHLSMAAGWKKVVEHYRMAGARLIGLTGSPQRLDGRSLGDAWDVMVQGPAMSWLIEQGFLSRYRAFAPAGIDTSSLHTRRGEFVQSEMEDLLSGKAVMANAVQHWRKYALGKRTLAFTPSIKRSEALATSFRANGVRAIALDGNTPVPDRQRAFLGFADREIDVIVNCQLFCEGFDLAAQIGRKVAIEAVLDYAPTQSLARFLQKMGRGLRADGSNKPHDLIDLVGNIARHGLPDDEREWSLDGKPESKSRNRETGERIIICEKCFAAYPPAPQCPICGHANKTQARKIKEIEGELEEIDVEAQRRATRVEQAGAQTLDSLILLGRKRGYKSPEKWAAHVWTARQAKASITYREAGSRGGNKTGRLQEMGR